MPNKEKFLKAIEELKKRYQRIIDLEEFTYSSVRRIHGKCPLCVTHGLMITNCKGCPIGFNEQGTPDQGCSSYTSYQEYIRAYNELISYFLREREDVIDVPKDHVLVHNLIAAAKNRLRFWDYALPIISEWDETVFTSHGARNQSDELPFHL